jgi:predicted glycosyltransferase
MRFLFYSHDGLGLGHTRRHIAVASALSELSPGASILLATGADDMTRIGLPPNVEVLKLPGLRKLSNEAYGSRRLQIPADDLRAIRSALLTTTVKSYRPAVTLVDKHPFGAKGEFREALDHIRIAGGRTVLGLRDILDTPETVAKEWGTPRLLELVPDYYDRVLIYGEQALFDPITAYSFPREVAARTRFCGYVVNRESTQPDAGAELAPAQSENGMHPVVVATTGGGEDGFFLLETFIRAASGSGWQAIVIAGPMTPEPQLQKLKSLATEHGVVLRTFVPRLSSLFGSIDALVCMGGYNTLIEAVSTGVPIVCAPRTLPRMEQYLRAAAFEKHGLLRMVRRTDLNPEHLREQIELALKTSRQKLLDRSKSLLSLDGAHQAAAELLALVAESPLRRERAETIPSPTRSVASPVYAR